MIHRSHSLERGPHRDVSLGVGRAVRALTFAFLVFATGTSSNFLLGRDSAPLLMSRTGGGAWSNLAELEASAKNGNAKAQAQLGEILLRGDGLPKDKPRALALLEQAAKAGEASASFRLGMLYDEGDGVPRDRAKALTYFRTAAAGGVPEAFYNIGAAYAGARGVRRDYAEALAWLILAKKRGTNDTAESALRARIQTMRRPEWIAAAERRAPQIEAELAPSPASAEPAAAMKKGASPASASAGVQVPATSVEFKVPTLTLDAANIPALKVPTLPGFAAPIHSEPIEITSPTGRTLHWASLDALQLAADGGEATALFGLGYVLIGGRHAVADPARAEMLLEKSAKAGNADAAHQLGELYAKGDKLPRNDARAFAYTLQAAKGGSFTAAYNLGALYANGRGTGRDYTQALAWLLVAQHFNINDGQVDRIRDYLKKTKPAEISVAEKRAETLIRDISAARQDLAKL